MKIKRTMLLVACLSLVMTFALSGVASAAKWDWNYKNGWRLSSIGGVIPENGAVQVMCMHHNQTPITVNCVYGPATTSAVKHLQQMNGLALTDGRAGDKTYASMQKELRPLNVSTGEFKVQIHGKGTSTYTYFKKNGSTGSWQYKHPNNGWQTVVN